MYKWYSQRFINWIGDLIFYENLRFNLFLKKYWILPNFLNLPILKQIISDVFLQKTFSYKIQLSNK